MNLFNCQGDAVAMGTVISQSLFLGDTGLDVVNLSLNLTLPGTFKVPLVGKPS